MLAAAGIVAVCAAASLSATPALAGSVAPTGAVLASASQVNAPLSGHQVVGARYGAAAVRAAGAAAADFRQAAKDRFSAAGGAPGHSPAATVLHRWWGSFPDAQAGTGLMATQSVSSTFRLSHSGDVLYAPTMDPPENSCIEVVTVHNHKVAQVWAWDWCSTIAPAAIVSMNASFLATYTTTVNGQPAYTVKDVQTSTSPNTWTAYLFNQTTQAWDTLFTSSGNSQTGLPYGWDMFEFYSGLNTATGHTDVCDDLAKSGITITSTSLQVLNGTTWHPATAADSPWRPSAQPHPSNYKCPNIHFTTLVPTSAWSVNVSP